MHLIRSSIDRFRADHEEGFVAVFLALVLTIMLIFAAFTVDFGSWYTRSAEIKRAADAAALAGVVWMPEYDLARAAALDAAAKNGFDPSTNSNITVSVDTIANNNRQLRVTIRDKKAKQFFSRLVTGSQSIGRSSLAEYVLPVPLGSPENVFGTGNLSLTGQPATQNFWAAVNGYCAGHESGDPKLAFWESYSTSSSGCNNTSAQNVDDYDPNGYLYAIDLPQNASSMKLDVYDGTYNTSGSAMDKPLANGSDQVTTIFTTYNRNPTPLDDSAANLATLANPDITLTTNQSTSTYQNAWANLKTWSNPQAGRYYVRVKTPVQSNNSRASNGFALRVWTGGSFSVCSTSPAATNYSATCPQLHAISDMSIYANLTGSQATFYLAQIDQIHAGKTLRVNLFDTGEGASTVEILGPSGSTYVAKSFTWSTPCNISGYTNPYNNTCGGTTSALDVADSVCPGSSCPQPYPSLHSSSKFSDRFITIDITLPTSYNGSCPDQNPCANANYWWKIRYTMNGSTPPTDRTTWSANIVGDPVHLLQ
jgi:Flp pilus assembly protein TadG